MSVYRAKAEVICSLWAFPVLTQLRHGDGVIVPRLIATGFTLYWGERKKRAPLIYAPNKKSPAAAFRIPNRAKKKRARLFKPDPR
jgi:hypothetical protein